VVAAKPSGAQPQIRVRRGWIGSASIRGDQCSPRSGLGSGRPALTGSATDEPELHSRDHH
jgi:hypothetical protein